MCGPVLHRRSVDHPVDRERHQRGHLLGDRVATDGDNTLTSSTPCSVYVDELPWFSEGDPGGTPSPKCEPYRSHGTVIEGLAEARKRAAPKDPENYAIAGPISGSPAADYGSYFSGEGRTLQCVFYRKHYVVLIAMGEPRADYNLAALWMNNGPGGGGAV